jgi:hypothetical protein
MNNEKIELAINPAIDRLYVLGADIQSAVSNLYIMIFLYSICVTTQAKLVKVTYASSASVSR